MLLWFVFFFKQKTAYEMRISDWGSDVCSSDLEQVRIRALRLPQFRHIMRWGSVDQPGVAALSAGSSVKSVGLPCQCDLFGSSQQQNQPPPLSNGADASEYQAAFVCGQGVVPKYDAGALRQTTDRCPKCFVVKSLVRHPPKAGQGPFSGA